MLRKTLFLSKNGYFSKFHILQFLLYLCQFLDYIGPFYHFGILKVWTLSVCMIISIIISNIVTMFEKSSLIFFESVSNMRHLWLWWHFKAIKPRNYKLKIGGAQAISTGSQLNRTVAFVSCPILILWTDSESWQNSGDLGCLISRVRLLCPRVRARIWTLTFCFVTL